MSVIGAGNSLSKRFRNRKRRRIRIGRIESVFKRSWKKGLVLIVLIIILWIINNKLKNLL